MPSNFRPARGRAMRRASIFLRALRIPATAHALSFDASEHRDRHMPCRRLGCAKVHAIRGDKHRMKTSTLKACGSDRPRRRRVERGTTRHPLAGLTSCYCAEGRRWILLARPGSGRHTGQAMENVTGSPDRRGETGPLQPAQTRACTVWRRRWAWPAARSGRRRGYGLRRRVVFQVDETSRTDREDAERSCVLSPTGPGCCHRPSTPRSPRDQVGVVVQRAVHLGPWLAAR